MRERRVGPAPSTALTAPEIRKAADGLGARLKAMFDRVASEPMPHEIIDLVDKLDGQVRPARKRTH
jgi:hypothetical protein